MAEAEFVLKPDFDITKAEAKINKLKREFEDSKRKAAEIKNTIKDLTEELELEKGKQVEIREVNQEQVKAAAELDRMIAKVESGNATTQEVIDLGNIDTAKAKLAEMENKIQRNETAYDKSSSASKKISSELSKQNNLLAKQNGQTATIGEKISISAKKTNKFSEAFEKSEKAGKRFWTRLKNIALSALFFSLVTKALTGLREQFGKMITEQGTKTAELAAKLKGGLSVIGTTLYESAKPAIEWTLNALVKMVNILANGLAKILGKDINEMRNLAKQTEKTGKEAKKTSGALAGFDELNTFSKNDSSSDNSATADFSALNDGIDSEIAILTILLSGAALILGVILAFTGVAIGLGIALMVIGAAGLVSAIAASWDTLPNNIQNTILIIFGIVSVALLVLGAIFCFTGHIPLGVAFLALGAIGLATVAAVAMNKLPDDIKNVVSIIAAIVAGALIVIGIILLASGVALPLGLGLLVAGAALLVGTTVANRNLILTKIKEVWANIANWWDTHVSKYFTVKYWADKVKNILNGIGDKITNSKVGKFFGSIGSSVGNGIKNLFTTQSVTASTPSVVNSTGFRVPALATGAVLPGGSPMLAWVNDQPQGQDYVEGSVENIAAAFAKYFADKNFGNAATQDNRPIILQIDGREIARAARDGNQRLGTQTVTGGFSNAY